MDKRMLVLIVAIVVIVAAAAAYLLTRDGGDEAQGYTVTLEDFEDAAHPDVKIEITDSEGKVIADGKAAVDGDVEFGAKITTCHEITGFTMSPADRAKLISLEKTGETDDGLVYEAKFSVTDGKDVAVGFNITFGEVAKKNTLTLTSFADPDKTGAKVEYFIGEDAVTGELELTEDVTVTVKVTCKDFIEDVKINATPAGSVSKVGDIVLNIVDTGYAATITVNVKAGQDVTLGVTPVVNKGSSEPNAYIGIIADKGVKVTYGEAQFGDGDTITPTDGATLTIDAGEGVETQYVLSWGSTAGKVTEGSTVQISIPDDTNLGTLYIGKVAKDAEMPEFMVKDASTNVDVEYFVGDAKTNLTTPFNKSTDLTLKITTDEGETLKALYVYVSWEYAPSTIYAVNIGSSVSGTFNTVIEDFAWGKGDATISIIPVYELGSADTAKITVESPEQVSVSYGTTADVKEIVPKDGSSISFETTEPGTITYTFTWGEGQDAITMTGSSHSFFNQKVTMNVNEIISKLGAGKLVVTFTDADGNVHEYEPEAEEPETPGESETPSDRPCPRSTRGILTRPPSNPPSPRRIGVNPRPSRGSPGRWRSSPRGSHRPRTLC